MKKKHRNKKDTIYIKIVKPVFDLFFAFVLLVISSPFMLLIAILIKAGDGGRILFKQERPGKDARIFTLYKFRTMRDEPEMVNKTEHDKARLTGFGRFLRKLSLDELPQLVNILKGEMSFVGPRPLLVEYLDLYSEEQRKRHDVKPGISGWAQVNGRNAISWTEKFNYDIFYVKNVGIWLDIRIVCRTIMNIVTVKNVDQDKDKTVDLFNGSN